ncbi:hypothetical protein GCM10009743_11170 [Kribbella swartbergensis]
MRPRCPELGVSTPARVLTRPRLPTGRSELLLLMLAVATHRELLRALRQLLRPLRLLRVLARLVLRLLRLVLGHGPYSAGRT